MSVMFWIWLGVIVAAVIIEFITLDLISIWFSVGAVIPFILSIFKGMPIWVEVVTFVVSSLLLIIFMRKVAQKWLYRNGGAKTNLDALEGRAGKLLESITLEENGAVKFNGIVWTAVSVDGQPIEKGNFVEVVKIQGNKLVVKPSKLNETENNIEENSQEKGN